MTLAAGDDVTCTFRHAREGTLTDHEGGGRRGGRRHASPSRGRRGSPATTRQAKRARSPVLPGTYVVTEVVPDGWSARQHRLRWRDGDLHRRDHGAHQRLRARRHDRQRAARRRRGRRLHLHEHARRPARSWCARVASAARASSPSRASRTSRSTRACFLVPEHQIVVPAGTHVVQEIVPAGWRLTGLACTGTAAVNLATATATVTVAAGERVSCELHRREARPHHVVKAMRGESTTAFAFTVPPALAAPQPLHAHAPGAADPRRASSTTCRPATT